jgi:hypothetical protein
MFDRIAVIHTTQPSQNNDRVIKEMGNKIGEKIDGLLAVKDRVDISLAEYERLKNNVKQYEDSLRKMGELITRMGIPVEVIESIIPDSVAVYHNNDPIEFKRHYCVKFDVYDDPDFRKYTHDY